MPRPAPATDIGARVITTQFATRCSHCSRVIPPGTVAAWAPGAGVAHLQCHDPTAPAPLSEAGRVQRLWTGHRWAAARDARGVFLAPVRYGLLQADREYLQGASPEHGIAEAQERERRPE
jgi:hypothetical protein